MKKINTTQQIILATLFAIILGSIVGEPIRHVEFIGKIWLRIIQMSIIVLIMSSISTAIGNVEGANAGKMSALTFKYIIIFTVISSVIGVVLGLVIKPGIGVDLGAATEAINETNLGNTSLVDTLVNFVPTNIFQAMAEGATVQTIVFSLIFGVAAGTYANKSGSKLVLQFLTDVNGIVMEIISMAMKLAPIGIFALLAPVAGTTGLEVIVPMIKFLLALFIADLIMFITYFPYTAIKVGVDPRKMPKKFSKMAIMALTTTSGAICLPTKMEDSVTKFGVSKEITNFTGPITMSMNSSGAVACYIIAILFMAQASGIVLTPIEILTGVLLAFMMVMGTISVPGGSVVVYTFFATALGLPLESIAILIAIDWFAGALRTIMNVTIDVLVAMLVAHDLGELDYDVYNDKKIVEY